VSCSAVSFILASHLLYDPDLLHEQAGAFAGKPGALARHAKILTWAAACDDIHGRQLRAVQLCDVPDMAHLREPQLCHFDGKGFDLACPQWCDSIVRSRLGKPADPIEKAPQRQHC